MIFYLNTSMDYLKRTTIMGIGLNIKLNIHETSLVYYLHVHFLYTRFSEILTSCMQMRLYIIK